MSYQAEQLTVEVSLLADPALWQWEIRDPSAGKVVRSSWQQEWTAYASADEARHAGEERLQGLKTSPSWSSSSDPD